MKLFAIVIAVGTTGSMSSTIVGATSFNVPIHLEAAPAATAVPVGVRPVRMALLTSGVRRYLRYTIKDGRHSPIDLWTRTVSFEEHEGARRLHIAQEWASDGTPTYTIDQDSWFDAATFRPLTHVRTIRSGGKTLIGGYRFEPSQIVGMKELPDNTRADFHIASPEPAFNFELDMELLQVLPWKPGYVADLVFYDPGQEPPKHYLFKFAGEARIAGPDGRDLDCWLVTADYNTGQVKSRFWLAKKTQIVVHEEAEDGGTLYVKTLIGAEAADLAKPA